MSNSKKAPKSLKELKKEQSKTNWGRVLSEKENSTKDTQSNIK